MSQPIAYPAGPPAAYGESHLSQLRLLAEELCCDLCRFEHVVNDGLAPETIQIDREYYLGVPGAFADIRVAPPGRPAYCVEIKHGYSNDTLLRHLRRKYQSETDAARGVSKLVLVIDAEHRPDWAVFEPELRQCLRPGLPLEVWDERRLKELLKARFQVEVQGITAENLLDVRQAIDRAKGCYAFGAPCLADYEHDPLKAALLWHFGFWQLRQLLENGRRTPREIFPPGPYRGVAVVLADLCAFSSYVRDTPDSEIIRESLTSFYSKARYQIINRGGMLSQFVGDEVIGLFGLPERRPDFAHAALDTALALLDIGDSVSHHWQRRIDRVQVSGGLHIGIAFGDLEIVSLRPFSRTHMGAIGDCINVAARLMAVAGSGEIVVTNSLLQELDESTQGRFIELGPVEARNAGRIKAWKLSRESR